MTELGEIFAELGIPQYLHDFLEQGFDTWDTILDITESDFDALGVKLGHRRKLQRKIANTRGISSDRALASPRHTPSDDRNVEEQKVVGAKAEEKDGVVPVQSTKRKYRRHPRPDEHAPERPPSAYVIFSNKMREELKGRNLSFTEIAKLVGENWQNLAPREKEPYELQASTAKEKYTDELAIYKKTDNYKDYSQYLVEFKIKQSSHPPASEVEGTKRPKLEATTSNNSSGTASSGASLYSGDTPMKRARHESFASMTSPLPTTDGHTYMSQPPTLPALNVAVGVRNGQASPSAGSPNLLLGYRESVFGGQQSIPWRDGLRDDNTGPGQNLSHLTSLPDRRSNITGPATTEGPSHQNHRRGHMQNHPPPFLASESTNRSTSSASTVSSSIFTPRTPMEPSIDRSLPMPSLYSTKAQGTYDHSLPPLRPASLSPQSTSLGSQQSPNGVHSFLEHPPPIAAIRGFSANTSQNLVSGEGSDIRSRDYVSQDSNDDSNNLDPVSVLLKAGEMISRNSQSRGSH